MFYSSVGAIENIGGKPYVLTKRNQIGWAIFGPYETFEPGHYSVRYLISVDEQDRTVCNDHDICCIVDAVADCGTKLLASKNLLVSRLEKDNWTTALDFTLDQPEMLEFRVYVTGKVGLVIQYEREVSLSQNKDIGPDFSPILKKGQTCKDPFFVQHFDKFKDLFEKGADVTVSDKGVVVRFFGVSFYVRNAEDFQLINEIFLINEYTFAMKQDVCLLDIGMNIGLTSLYLARFPFVKEIYSYEPFLSPYQRALDNFGLNPELSGKITAYNYGLGDASKEVTVFSDTTSTIGTSVRGKDSGTPEKIAIRDAANVFENIIREAASRNLRVAVKMDCEGSEFPIFERLETRDLIKDIDVFMIEWHKWWSTEKTQQDIISRLLKNDFVVFDHTNVFDPWAGQLYAARRQ